MPQVLLEVAYNKIKPDLKFSIHRFDVILKLWLLLR